MVKGVGLAELLVVQEADVASQLLGYHQVVSDDDDGCLEQGTHVVD